MNIHNDPLSIIRQSQSEPPVDVVAIARSLGLGVYSDIMPPNISGKLVRRADPPTASGYLILVNNNHALTRQRFTVAHEIAHFILHRNSIGDGINESVMYRADGLSSKQETEANQLAADILMPWHLLNNVIMNNAQNSVEALAAAFNVSPVAMSIRLGIPT